MHHLYILQLKAQKTRTVLRLKQLVWLNYFLSLEVLDKSTPVSGSSSIPGSNVFGKE